MSRSNNEVQAELLTAVQASALINVGKRTWWRYVTSGKAPDPIRIGGAVRWRRADLLNWIDEGCPPVPHSRR